LIQPEPVPKAVTTAVYEQMNHVAERVDAIEGLSSRY
jgi:hypothetical protein